MGGRHVRDGDDGEWGVMTHSMPGPFMGGVPFFSGFSNTHGKPLSWHLRHGDCGGGTGPGGIGRPRAVSGTGEPSARKDPRTSPSHRFLPFLQLVHARAPRFGMWTADEAPAVGVSMPGASRGDWGMSVRNPPCWV